MLLTVSGHLYEITGKLGGCETTAIEVIDLSLEDIFLDYTGGEE
ncbi:MAG: hypothetical protein ACOY31_06045 [Bacillota bacterium]